MSLTSHSWDITRKAKLSFRIPPPSSLEQFCACNDCAGKDPVRFACVDISTFHASRGHVQEKILRSTAKQLGIVLERSLRKCEGGMLGRLGSWQTDRQDNFEKDR